MTNSPRIIILPGLGNSGPQHWQSVWEAENPNFQRVHQRDWETPKCRDWVETLNQAIHASPSPCVLVAHSLACCLTAHWASQHSGPVLGALLVAPSDVEAPSYPPGTEGFQPMPLGKLPFPSITVASANDFYVSAERAAYFADCWGSRLVNIGEAGHINAASELGSWPQGMALLNELIHKQFR